MLPCIPKILDKTGYQAFSLSIATALATGLLLLTNAITAPAIAMRVQEDQLAGIAQVMPAKRYTNDLLATEQSFTIGVDHYVVYSAATDTGITSGYVVQTEAIGYAGPIKLLIGVDDRLQILGVRVLSHAETPGLGDKIELSKHDWVLSFNHRSLENTPSTDWAVAKDGGVFDQFSGATITPRAVVNAVHTALIALRHTLSVSEQPNAGINPETKSEETSS